MNLEINVWLFSPLFFPLLLISFAFFITAFLELVQSGPVSGGGDCSVPVNPSTHRHRHTNSTRSLSHWQKVPFSHTHRHTLTPSACVFECRCGSFNPRWIPQGGEEGYWKEKRPWLDLKDPLVFGEYTAASCFIVQRSICAPNTDRYGGWSPFGLARLTAICCDFYSEGLAVGWRCEWRGFGWREHLFCGAST